MVTTVKVVAEAESFLATVVATVVTSAANVASEAIQIARAEILTGTTE